MVPIAGPRPPRAGSAAVTDGGADTDFQKAEEGLMGSDRVPASTGTEPAGGDVAVCALYQFVRVEDPAALRSALATECARLGLKGTLLVASEGINGTVAGTDAGVAALEAWLAADGRFARLTLNRSRAPAPPFQRMKVKLKHEIVSLGVPGIDPGTRTGTHVSPEAWNALIDDPAVTVIDTRNDYEVRIGSFRGAVSAGTRHFRQFPEFAARSLDPDRDRRIAMFCTGGIRCEKATALLIAQGFDEVYQLEGGILNYLTTVPEARSSWEGACFVFDDRVALRHDMSPGGYLQCHACRRPLSDVETASADYVPGVSCPYCVGQTRAEQRERFAERTRQVALAKARGTRHIAQDMDAARALRRRWSRRR